MTTKTKTSKKTRKTSKKPAAKAVEPKLWDACMIHHHGPGLRRDMPDGRTLLVFEVHSREKKEPRWDARVGRVEDDEGLSSLARGLWPTVRLCGLPSEQAARDAAAYIHGAITLGMI